MIPGLQVEETRKALLEAYSKDTLKDLLRFRLNKRLGDIVADGPLRTMVSQLLEESEMEGWQGALVREAYRFNPQNEALLQVYEKYGYAPKIDLVESGQPVAGVDSKATSSGLQKIIFAGNEMIDIDTWRVRLAQVECRVCRIDIGTRAQGTGFLVGPGVVLTNYHVMKDVIEGKKQPVEVSCLFDFKVLANNKQDSGTRVKLKLDQAILAWSPYSASETTSTPDAVPPTEDELDFALLQLAKPFPTDPEESARGFEVLPVSTSDFTADQGLIIAQHPAGKPMKLAIDTKGVIGVNTNGTRVRYRNNTEGGSSGSPVFDMMWNLSALHHYGDPNFQTPTFNQGIAPLHLIRKKITDAGFGALLGSMS